MFEKAARMKLRFQCKGSISAEDLWDLSLKELDLYYSQLMAKQKQSQETTLLKKKTEADETLDFQIAIVKHIVEVRLKEQEDREVAAQRKMQKQEIAAIIAEKKGAELRDKSVEELEAMYKQL